MCTLYEGTDKYQWAPGVMIQVSIYAQTLEHDPTAIAVYCYPKATSRIPSTSRGAADTLPRCSISQWSYEYIRRNTAFDPALLPFLTEEKAAEIFAVVKQWINLDCQGE